MSIPEGEYGGILIQGRAHYGGPRVVKSIGSLPSRGARTRHEADDPARHFDMVRGFLQGLHGSIDPSRTDQIATHVQESLCIPFVELWMTLNAQNVFTDLIHGDGAEVATR